MEEALEAVGLWPMQEYVNRLQATIEEYINTRPIYEMCTGVEWIQGTSGIMWWWYEDHSQAKVTNGVR